MNFIQPKECKRLISSNKSILLIDVREKYELEECQTKDSIHIPMAEMESQLHLFKENNQIVLMCKTGKRAEALCNYLVTEFNISNVLVLEGGILAYLENDHTD